MKAGRIRNFERILFVWVWFCLVWFVLVWWERHLHAYYIDGGKNLLETFGWGREERERQLRWTGYSL